MEPSTTIDCLVCGAPTKARHLGVGCRACIIFYRRSLKREKPHKCKSGTNDCEIEWDESAACKSCRFERLQYLMDHPESITSEGPSPSTSADMPEIIAGRPLTPVLDRLRKHYNTFCKTRISSELAHRAAGSDLLDQMASGNFKLAKVDLNNLTKNNEALIPSFFQFVADTFDEFSTFDTQEKWTVVRNCYEIFFMIESAYNTWKHFGDDMRYSMATQTSYYDKEGVDSFFDAHNSAEIRAAKTLFTAEMDKDLAAMRAAIRESPIDEVELAAAIGLELWNGTDGLLPVPEHVAVILEEQRKALLQDLHVYYNEVLKCDDYAARLGRLFLLVVRLKALLPRARENIEMWLLMEKEVDESALSYQFYRMDLKK